MLRRFAENFALLLGAVLLVISAVLAVIGLIALSAAVVHGLGPALGVPLVVLAYLALMALLITLVVGT
jgi:hypothetical protein